MGRPGSSCWPAKHPASRSWATVPMDRARPSPPWARPSTAEPSSPGRCQRPSRGLRPRRLRRGRRRPGPPPARPVTPSRSRPSGTRCSGFAAAAVRSETAAQRPRRAGRFAFILTTTSWSSPVGRGETATSPRTTDGGGPWSNAPSHGLWPTATDGSDSVACERNQLGLSLRIAAINLQTAGQPRAGQRRRLETQCRLTTDAQARVVKKGPLFGLCPPGWPTSTLFMPALRSDISRACDGQLTPRELIVQQSPSATPGSSAHWTSDPLWGDRSDSVGARPGLSHLGRPRRPSPTVGTYPDAAPGVSR